MKIKLILLMIVLLSTIGCQDEKKSVINDSEAQTDSDAYLVDIVNHQDADSTDADNEKISEDNDNRADMDNDFLDSDVLPDDNPEKSDYDQDLVDDSTEQDAEYGDHDVQTSICGDNQVQGNEACDGNSKSCTDFNDIAYLSGTAVCKSDCSGYDRTNCVPTDCGNKIIEGSELCDGNLKDCSKIDPRFERGKALCQSNCLSYDLGDCIEPVCGDKRIGGNEICDSNLKDCSDIDPEKYARGKASCLDDCTGYNLDNCEEPVCGNDIVEISEKCDNDTKNCVDIDSEKYARGTAVCLDDCTGYNLDNCEEPVCGNDIVEAMEECDNDSAQCSILFPDLYESGVASCKDDCTGYDLSQCVAIVAYSNPYGTGISINVNAHYILTDEQQISQDMVTMSAFATGTFGSSGNIPPEENSYHYAVVSESYVKVRQGSFDDTSQNNYQNFVILEIEESAVFTGNTINVGMGEEYNAILKVVDLNYNSFEIMCHNAFGEGLLNIVNADLTPGVGGELIITGTVDLYSPVNYKDQGDITGDLGVTACSPK